MRALQFTVRLTLSAHPSFTVRMMQTHCFLHLQQTADIKSFFFIANVLLKRSLMLQFALGFVAVFPSIAQSGLGVNLLEHPLLRRLAAVKNVCHVLAVEWWKSNCWEMDLYPHADGRAATVTSCLSSVVCLNSPHVLNPTCNIPTLCDKSSIWSEAWERIRRDL